MPSPRIVRATRRGHPGFMIAGRWYPLIAGAEEPTDAEKEAAAKAEADKAEADKAAEAAKKAEDDKLGDPGKKALESEREARKKAEKDARDAQRKLKEIEDAKLSDTEKLKKEAEDGKALAATATTKLRTANLRDALSDKGFAGSKAKAVAKLLDGVEYDDEDEPTNLDDRLKAAEKEYGDLVKPGDGKPKAPNIDNGDKASKDTPKLTADQLEAAKKAGMTPERYAAFMHGGSIDDFNRVKDAEKKK